MNKLVLGALAAGALLIPEKADLDSTHAGVQLQPNVAALQIEHDPFAILEPDSRHASANGSPCTESGVGACNVGSPTQVAGAA